MAKETSIERIGSVLLYIERNLHLPLGIHDIAERSCWSRWQLQRVFQGALGISVAQYVRELKLSVAAEMLLDSSTRVIDIGLELGFSSEMSFSRSFKQMFGVSPRTYRKQQQRTGLRKPILLSQFDALDTTQKRFVEVRVETKPAFFVKGVHEPISGLFSLSPDFAEKVPALWEKLHTNYGQLSTVYDFFTGVIDVTQAHLDGRHLEYWAGVELDSSVGLPELPLVLSPNLAYREIPTQTYAVIKHKGDITELPDVLRWFIFHWLPSSSYRGVDGYELERYPADFDIRDSESEMEYWIPIEKMTD